MGLRRIVVLLADASLYGSMSQEEECLSFLSFSRFVNILFQAIAWKNQDDYERGGYKMLVNTHKEVRKKRVEVEETEN